MPMKSFIIPGLDNNDKQLLHNHGVIFYPWNGDDILINETQLENVLQILDATATQQVTEYEDMLQLTLTFNPTAKTNVAGRVMDRAHAQSRANYIKVTSQRLAEFINQATSRTAEKKKKVGPAADRFVKLARQSYVAQNAGDKAALEQFFADQYEQLLQVPKVRAVRVTSGAILVYTDLLTATDPKTGITHELGEFMIFIRTDGMEEGVRWFNSTRRVRTVQSGMNAPRIFADGTACTDEVKETLLELIAQFEFATVADMAIQFAETLSDDELSKQIDKWPVAKG